MIRIINMVNDNNINNDAILSWDEYFMTIALIASLRSKDPNTKVGACIVDVNNHVLGTGYNGFIKGVDESCFPLSRDGEWLNTKYPYVIHAEVNCILNSVVSSLKDATLFCTLYPCNECAKQIIQSGIKRVVFLDNKHKDDKIYLASQRLFEVSGTKLEQLKSFSKEKLINLLSSS